LLDHPTHYRRLRHGVVAGQLKLAHRHASPADIEVEVDGY
jgi:hypothetical protein